MRALAVELQGISKQFRHCQKDYFQRLKGQEDFGKDSIFHDDHDSKSPLSMDEAMDKGFSPEQVAAMAEMERSASEREKEILKIAQSVNDLAQVFKELNVLIIEQGTILDRIDYNIEQSLIKVKEGVQELQKANEISKKSRSVKCMAILLLIIIILSIILGVKHSGNKNNQ
jgi:syntaxin 16